MNRFTGTIPLVRIALRRDRIQLALWIVALGGLITAMAATYIDFFQTDAELIAATALYAQNPVLRMFSLASGASVGGYVMIRGFTILAVLAALMSILTVVRHTRQNEDTGRAEMIGAAVVGRYAGLTAALIVTAAADVVLALLIGLALVALGLPAAGAFTAGAAVAGVGIAFGGVAAVTAQVAGNGRGATGLGASVLGLAFLLSAVGNILGSTTDGGVAVTSAWPAWLSPIGWGQQMRPFGGNHWWPLLLFVALFVALTGAAYALAGRRDIGRGLLPEGRGPATAPRGLLSPIGLAWRLQRSLFLGWAAGVIVAGLVYGAVSSEIEGILSDLEGSADLLTRLGGTNNVLDAYFASIMTLMGAVIAAYTVQVLLRMRAEETDGPLDSVLGAAVSRPRWMLSHVANAALGTAGLLLLLGLSTGLAAGLALDEGTTRLGTLTEAAIAQAPAAYAIAGLAIAAFGLVPRRTAALAWAGFAVALVLGPIGAILDLPRTVQEISPFTHTPNLPGGEIAAAPIIALLAVAAALTAAGFVTFRRRDLVT